MCKAWTLDEIKKVMNDISLKAGISVEDIPISISKRMTRCQGLCEYIIKDNNYKTTAFRFSQRLIDGRYPEEVVKQVIIHEYAHHYTNTKTNKAQNHNANFKKTCRMLGISDNTYFQDKIPERDDILNDNTNNYNYKIVCKKCGEVYKRENISENILTFEKIYRCSKCTGKLNVYCLNTLKTDTAI